MNKRTLLFVVFLAVTAGLVYLANETYQGRSDDFAAQTGDVFLPELKDRVNDTAIIKVTTPEGPATLERKGDFWTVKERGGYLASQANVNRLLVGLSFLKTIEPKTSKPERYERIGLEEPGTDGSTGNLYVIEDGAGKVLSQIVVGDRKPARANPNANEFYVRVPGNPQAWLVEGTLPISSDVVDWIDDALFELDVHRVKRVVVAHGDGEVMDVARTPGVDEGFAIQNVPAGREVENPLLVRNVATGIMKFILDDVSPESEAPPIEKPDVTLTVTTYDGLEVKMTGVRAEEDFVHFQMRASYLADSAQHVAPKGEPQLEGDHRIERLDEETVRAEMEKMNAAWGNWRFEVGKWRIATADKRVSDFLKAKPGEETTGSN